MPGNAEGLLGQGHYFADEGIMVHLWPIWRDLADFMIMARIEPTTPAGRFEQLWAQRRNEREFMLCCIPAFAYGLCLGDLVAVAPSGEFSYVAKGVVRRSGRSTFRVWFEAGSGDQVEVLRSIEAVGGFSERISQNYVAIDAPDNTTARRVFERLDAGGNAGEFVFENGSGSPGPP